VSLSKDCKSLGSEKFNGREFKRKGLLIFLGGMGRIEPAGKTAKTIPLLYILLKH